MVTRRIEQVDALTGEIIEGGLLVLQRPKRTNGFQHGGWVAMDQTKQQALAVNKRITLEAHRVLAVMIGACAWDNWVPINQAATARNMGMQRSNFARALRILIEEGYVEKGPGADCGMRPHFRLSPEYTWKGSAKSHRDALNARMKRAGLSLVASKPDAQA